MNALAARWLDRLAGSDPGLNRLRAALMMVASVAGAVAGEWLLVHFTHAPASPASHVTVVIAELIGALVALLSVLFVTEPGPRAQLVSSALVAVPMLAFMAIGLVLGAWRVPSLVFLVAALAGGTYLRRFGARGFLVGLMIFLGFFLGFFLRGGDITLSGIGWPSAEVAVGLAAAVIVRFGLFYPRPDRTLQRTRRSYEARARKVIGEALAVVGQPGPRTGRLERELARLNETALMIDAQLGNPAALPGASPRRLHELLFAAEHALTEVAHSTEEIARLGLTPAQLDPVRRTLNGLHAGDVLAVEAAARNLGDDAPAAAYRLATAALAVGIAMNDREAPGGVRDAAEGFRPAVALNGGWLLGAAVASAAASGEAADHFWDRARLRPYNRAAIQVGVAAALAIAFGDLISGARFYWAVFPVIISFAGTSNAGEQVQKAASRVLGTAAGVVAGSAIAALTGDNAWASLTVILAAVFLGTYLTRVSYAFLVVGITVQVAQIYEQLGEYSGGILVTRLEETIAGAAIAALTAIAVVPLRSRKVLGVALRSYLQALTTLLAHAPDDNDGIADAGGLRADARRLDDATHALIAAARPFQCRLLGKLSRQATEVIALAGTLRRQARNQLSQPGARSAPEAGAQLGTEAGNRAINESIVSLTRVAAEMSVTAGPVAGTAAGVRMTVRPRTRER